MAHSICSAEGLRAAAPEMFAVAARERGLESVRRRLAAIAQQMEFDTFYDYHHVREGTIIRVRDCAQAFRSILTRRSEDLAGFSVARAIYDIARNRHRPDLFPAFFADLGHILLGLQGRGVGKAPADRHLETSHEKGRQAAIDRSRQLDLLQARIETSLAKFASGTQESVVRDRERRKARILAGLGGTDGDWLDWQWQMEQVIRDPETLERLVTLAPGEQGAIREACERKIPFGITPYYLSLMDDEPSERDRAIRAQVIPPLAYVCRAAVGREDGDRPLDFMLEEDTSPLDLITRRYPAVVIFKPYNTCPQICVYCQRNWEIEGVLDPSALAAREQIADAFTWLRDHPGVHEVLLTGGDPLALSDDQLRDILGGIAAIPSIERIRIGTRALVTMPMRLTEELCALLGEFRVPGRREVVVVTHVQHPYEVTPETTGAVERIRREGISVFNQMVFTFYNSRRFEAASLRRLLRLVGISPYYTFNAKGKEETRDYQVPVSRLLQEQKEEARLLPGLERTDEAVYNVPGLGKNYLRARQHRYLLAVLADGSRVYEYLPWEVNISGTGPLSTYIATDVPILGYLERLAEVGEDVTDYETIWYYF